MKLEGHPRLAAAVEKLKNHPKASLFVNANDFTHFCVWAFGFAADYATDEMDFDDDDDCEWFNAFMEMSTVHHEPWRDYAATHTIDHNRNHHVIAICRQVYDELTIKETP